MTPREAFRKAVFKRDRNRCVVCKAPGIAAHHIVPRGEPEHSDKPENGVCLCGDYHLLAEADEALRRLNARGIATGSAILTMWSRSILLAHATKGARTS